MRKIHILIALLGLIACTLSHTSDPSPPIWSQSFYVAYD